MTAPTPSLRCDDAVLLAFADEVGPEGAVVARGHGTHWDLGGPVDPAARVVTAPVGVVDYEPAEMTVRVRAGTPVVELEATLAERGQRSALSEGAGTVGGAVAVGRSHLSRRGRGAVPASVLQVRYVSAEGRMVTGGGPTVKNVTGYDLPRLLVGSLGTLGLVAEVILRTNPRPAVACWLRSDDADPLTADRALLRPGAVLWDGTTTWVELEGHRPDVDADRRALSAVGRWDEVEGPPDRPPHRWSLPPAALPALAGGDRPDGGGDGGAGGDHPGWPDPGPFVASIGVGTVWASTPAPERPVDPGVAAVARRLKDNFDPTGRLAPGRTLGRP